MTLNFRHPGTRALYKYTYSFIYSDAQGSETLRAERQSALMSKITNDDLARSGTWCFAAIPTWQQWASKG